MRNQAGQPNSCKRARKLNGQQKTSLRIVERPTCYKLRHQRTCERDLEAGQNESGKQQHQQVALAGCSVDGDGLRAHWLSTILQDCGAASNPVFFCGLFAPAQKSMIPILSVVLPST